MSDFLTNLVARSAPDPAHLAPRLPSRFEVPGPFEAAIEVPGEVPTMRSTDRIGSRATSAPGRVVPPGALDGQPDAPTSALAPPPPALSSPEPPDEVAAPRLGIAPLTVPAPPEPVAAPSIAPLRPTLDAPSAPIAPALAVPFAATPRRAVGPPAAAASPSPALRAAERQAAMRPADPDTPRQGDDPVASSPDPVEPQPPGRQVAESTRLLPPARVVPILVPYTPPLAPYAPRPAAGAARSEPPPAAPTIQVSIGRVEVRATAPAAPARREPRRSAVMPLDEYLRSRRGGA